MIGLDASQFREHILVREHISLVQGLGKMMEMIGLDASQFREHILVREHISLVQGLGKMMEMIGLDASQFIHPGQAVPANF